MARLDSVAGRIVADSIPFCVVGEFYMAERDRSCEFLGGGKRI